jgi:hypothetical protein
LEQQRYIHSESNTGVTLSVYHSDDGVTFVIIRWVIGFHQRYMCGFDKLNKNSLADVNRSARVAT